MSSPTTKLMIMTLLTKGEAAAGFSRHSGGDDVCGRCGVDPAIPHARNIAVVPDSGVDSKQACCFYIDRSVERRVMHGESPPPPPFCCAHRCTLVVDPDVDVSVGAGDTIGGIRLRICPRPEPPLWLWISIGKKG